MSDIEKALAVFQGMSSGDSALATKYMDPERYVEHNPHARDGVEGVKQYVDRIAASHPDLKVIRAYQDGPYVVTQADGHVQGRGVFFDVFRFEDGRIVEHWAFSAPAGPPNTSGHTQADGPTEAAHDADTEQNKALVRDYYQTVHIEGRHHAIPRYFSGDRCVRHEPGAADGVGAFMRDLQILTRDRTIDEIKLLLGQGDFVFLAARGTHRGEPCVYIDLYRVEDAKIVEHWGFPEQVPWPDARKVSSSSTATNSPGNTDGH
ncbi:polyketide cyclase [Gemmatimonadetes bacterium T265]|nr:polyketide cyclase [Gemmatimonadetes bacterium T265]